VPLIAGRDAVRVVFHGCLQKHIVVGVITVGPLRRKHMKNAQKVLGVLLMAAAATGIAMATSVPEIAPGTAGNAGALVTGTVLMVRGRSK
jgi:hypothetical protein